MKVRKCPKCRSLPIQYIELWKWHNIEFNIDNDGFAEKSGNMLPGIPDGVIAICDKCDYEWKLRGVSQITELQNWDEASTAKYIGVKPSE